MNEPSWKFDIKDVGMHVANGKKQLALKHRSPLAKYRHKLSHYFVFLGKLVGQTIQNVCLCELLLHLIGLEASFYREDTKI